MNTIVVAIDAQLTNCVDNLKFQEQGEVQITEEVREVACEDYHGTCVICLSKTVLQETALVKGCEHTYCVTCILRWATYKDKPTCPQCKHPFESLDVRRSLDGSIHDCMHEESVCQLLRAPCFNPLIVEYPEEVDDEVFDYYLYEDLYNVEDEDDLDEIYLNCHPSRSRLRIGNRR